MCLREEISQLRFTLSKDVLLCIRLTETKYDAPKDSIYLGKRKVDYHQVESREIKTNPVQQMKWAERQE